MPKEIWDEFQALENSVSRPWIPPDLRVARSGSRRPGN